MWSTLPFVGGATSHPLLCCCRQNIWGNSEEKRIFLHYFCSSNSLIKRTNIGYKSANSHMDIHWVLQQRQALRGSQTASSTLLHPEEAQTQLDHLICTKSNKKTYMKWSISFALWILDWLQMSLCCPCWYLAVCDGIKLLTNLFWQDYAVFFGRQRMRGSQGINCKCTVDVTKDYQVFLQ